MRSSEAFEHEREQPRGGGRGYDGRRGRPRGGRGPDGPGRGFVDGLNEQVPQFGGHDDRMGEGSERPEGARRGSGRGRRGGRGGRFNRGPRDHPEGKLTDWEYLDPMGRVRGPFQAKSMLGWEKAGFFNEDLPVREIGANEFKNLKFFRPQMQLESGEAPSQPGPGGQFNQFSNVQDGNSGYERNGRPGPGPGRGGRGPGPQQFRFPLDYGVGVARRLFTADVTMGAEEPVWRYIDLKGEVQGPFPASQMLGWFERGYLDTLDLPICGTERRISPPDLPVANIHYQKFGYFLDLVHKGFTFTPLTPQHIESKTVPGFAEPRNGVGGGRFPDEGGRGGRRGRGRGRGGPGRGPFDGPGRGQFNSQGPDGPARDSIANGRGSEGRVLDERRGGGRGRRGGPPTDAAVAGPPIVPSRDISRERSRGPRGERGRGRGRGRGARQSSLQNEEVNAEQTGSGTATPKGTEPGARSQRKGKENREGRGRGRGRGGRRGERGGRKQVDVELQAGEDGLVKLKISPTKLPERRKRNAGAAAQTGTQDEEKQGGDGGLAGGESKAVGDAENVEPAGQGQGSAAPSFLITEPATSSRDSLAEVSDSAIPSADSAAKITGDADSNNDVRSKASSLLDEDSSVKALPGKITLEEDPSQVKDLPGKMTLEGDKSDAKSLPGKMTVEGDQPPVTDLLGKMTLEGDQPQSKDLPGKMTVEGDTSQVKDLPGKMTLEDKSQVSNLPGKMTVEGQQLPGAAGDTGEKEILDKSKAAEEKDSSNELSAVEKVAYESETEAPASPAPTPASGTTEQSSQTTPGLFKTHVPDSEGKEASTAEGQEDSSLLSSIKVSMTDLVETAKDKAEDLTSTDPYIDEKPVGAPTSKAISEAPETGSKSEDKTTEGKPAKKGLFQSILGKF